VGERIPSRFKICRREDCDVEVAGATNFKTT
jgi:hypothetical protein